MCSNFYRQMLRVLLTKLCSKLCWTEVAAHQHLYWLHQQGWWETTVWDNEKDSYKALVMI